MTRSLNRMRAVHPGEILREDFLVPLGMSVNALAAALGVPDTATRLARYFGGDATSWLNLQATYDLKVLPTHDEIVSAVSPRAA